MTNRRTSRRGNGEGSIYQLPNGRWRGPVFLGYRDGKQHRKYVTRRTRAEAARESGPCWKHTDKAISSPPAA